MASISRLSEEYKAGGIREKRSHSVVQVRRKHSFVSALSKRSFMQSNSLQASPIKGRDVSKSPKAEQKSGSKWYASNAYSPTPFRNGQRVISHVEQVKISK